MKEPTAEQCSSHDLVYETDTQIGYAIWYPQMGGYVGKAVVVFIKNDLNGCFEAFVWHDGQFPFSGDYGNSSEPVEIHHCSPEQFVDFGATVKALMEAKH